jgi:hypothetical protein
MPTKATPVIEVCLKPGQVRAVRELRVLVAVISINDGVVRIRLIATKGTQVRKLFDNCS